MEQYRNLEKVMAAETISKNETSSRIQMNRETYAIKLKALFIVVGLCICFSCFSQLSRTLENEVKLDGFSTVLKFPAISYERFLGKHVGTGLSVGFPLKSKNDLMYRFLILPYGRFYFGEFVTSTRSWTGDIHTYQYVENEHNCLFIEVNAGILGSKELNETTWRYHNNVTKFVLGATVGWKFLGRESFYSIGRYASKVENNVTVEVFFGFGWGIYKPRVGISIGYAF